MQINDSSVPSMRYISMECYRVSARFVPKTVLLLEKGFCQTIYRQESAEPHGLNLYYTLLLASLAAAACKFLSLRAYVLGGSPK